MSLNDPVPTAPVVSLKDQKKQIDIEVRRAELDLKKLELVKAEAEATQARMSAERAEMQLEVYRREDTARRATEGQLRIFSFDDVVTDDSAETLSDWLKNRSARFPGKEFTVYLNSPGGSIFAGFAAMDAIREAEDAGNKVTAKVTGMAASMAGVIAQAASSRLIGVNSELMLHSGATFQFGSYKTFEIEDQAEFIKRLTRKCMKAYADRSDKWDVEQLFEKIHGGKQDWWLTAQEAVAEGFMDGTF